MSSITLSTGVAGFSLRQKRNAGADLRTQADEVS
jgi:hypothetical protein